MPDILSVGIDIGTSTTQVIFSKLTMENTAGYFTVPRVLIVDKTVVYKSDIYITPLLDEVHIDADGVRKIAAAEFKKAGFAPEDTESGAVIITGESARKENSDAVLAGLSDFAGDFVVAAAGPDMESVIAGKGSGAYEYSMKNHCIAANLDIGGGTTNIVVFDDGSVAARGCFDIGGRLICVTPHMTVTKVSPAAKKIADAAGISIACGSKIKKTELEKITELMAKLLVCALGGGKSVSGEHQSAQSSAAYGEPSLKTLLKTVKTPGSTSFRPPAHIDAIFFSGGVADCIYESKAEDFPFGDIGVLLGRAVRVSALFKNYKVIGGGETIRATVIGAGTYTTTISGSTISYTEDLFPLKNIPVLKLDSETEGACYRGESRLLKEKISWFMAQNSVTRLMIAMDGLKNPDYASVCAAAKVIAESVGACFRADEPVLAVIKSDMAKAVGQMVHQYLDRRRPVIIIDGIDADDGDYVDMGHPVMNGMVIPVVVKTLIFG